MKKTILALAMLAILASCKKDSSEILEPEEVLSTDIKLMVKGETQESMPLYAASEKYNFLGYGYDVTDQFNSESSTRAGVVDMAAYAAASPGLIDLARGTESSSITILGKNAVDLSEKLSNRINSTKGQRAFGYTMLKAFPESTTTASKYVYGYYSYYMIWKRYRFYYDQRINSYLTTGFKQDLLTLNAEALVKKYGTHILTGLSIGSKFDVLYQADGSAGFDKEATAMEGIRYALAKTFGLFSGYLDEANLRNLNANAGAEIYYSSTGGDISKLKTEKINDRVILNLNNWVATTTEDKARFTGALNDGLTPLYELIDDVQKKEEVKVYIDSYLSLKAVKLTN